MLESDNINEPWIIAVYGDSTGAFDFIMHHVTSSDHIIVDDDFKEYPAAQTSSLVAAGYAIKDNGILTVANGQYKSALPVKIESENVRLRGQSKENVQIINLYNHNAQNHSALYFNSDGGKIQDFSACTGNNPYQTIIMNGNDVTAEHIDIKALGDINLVSGGLKASGKNIVLRNISLDSIRWGITIGAQGGILEGSRIKTLSRAIQASGSNIMIRNNEITLVEIGRAIMMETAQNKGFVIENNQINIKHLSSTGSGIITAQHTGTSQDSSVSYIRNNAIQSANGDYALSATIGNPSSKIIVENNVFQSTYQYGGGAILVQAGRSDGSSTILVRNNIFNGLVSWNAIRITGMNYLTDGQLFAICNNSFRIAPGAKNDKKYPFIDLYSGLWSEYTDTTDVYLINNIFEGNDSTYFAKFDKDFTIHSDYNVLYRFKSYSEGDGKFTGTANDIIVDPLFIDDNLHVDPSSPAIDTGAGKAIYNFMPSVDINGVVRPQGTRYDMGAYEKE